MTPSAGAVIGADTLPPDHPRRRSCRERASQPRTAAQGAYLKVRLLNSPRLLLPGDGILFHLVSNLCLCSHSFITTTAKAYNRNHSVIPNIDTSTHTVKVDGTVDTQLTLSISNLRNDFVQHEVVCALQCAGNRRHTMRTKLKEVKGVDWMDGAVMNCKWRGPRLRDVLNKAGIKTKEPEKSGLNVAFACFQVPCEDDDYYGGSIELWRAMQMDKEVILALDVRLDPSLLTPTEYIHACIYT